MLVSRLPSSDEAVPSLDSDRYRRAISDQTIRAANRGNTASCTRCQRKVKGQRRSTNVCYRRRLEQMGGSSCTRVLRGLVDLVVQNPLPVDGQVVEVAASCVDVMRPAGHPTSLHQVDPLVAAQPH